MEYIGMDTAPVFRSEIGHDRQTLQDSLRNVARIMTTATGIAWKFWHTEPIEKDQ